MSAQFSAARFTATKWATAEEKAKALNGLIRFIEAGFLEQRFTKAIYDALSQHLLGHCAEYDRRGFYRSWFATPGKRLGWLKYAVSGGLHGSSYGLGDPAWTWSDVETELIRWVTANGLADEYQQLVNRMTEQRELAELDRLIMKYGARREVAA